VEVEKKVNISRKKKLEEDVEELELYTIVFWK
jgi:hypothetical protein